MLNVNRSTNPIFRLGKFQQGSLIFIVLIAIAVIGSYSLTGMKGSLYSTKLVGSFIDYSLALQRAELALVAAEKNIGKVQRYEVSSIGKPEIRGMYPQFMHVNNSVYSSWSLVDSRKSWLDSSYVIHQLDSEGEILSGYIIEKLELMTEGGYPVFRVTTIGWGNNLNSYAILQTLIQVSVSNERLSWQIIH